MLGSSKSRAAPQGRTSWASGAPTSTGQGAVLQNPSRPGLEMVTGPVGSPRQAGR